MNQNPRKKASRPKERSLFKRRETTLEWLTRIGTFTEEFRRMVTLKMRKRTNRC